MQNQTLTQVHNGIKYMGAQSKQRKELRAIHSTDVGVESHSQISDSKNDILGNVTYFVNLSNNIILPSLNSVATEWKSIGYSPSDNTSVQSLKLSPKRMVSVANMSVTLTRENKDLSDTLGLMIESAQRDQLVSTMFSNVAEEEGENTHSKGLFNGAETYNVDAITDAMLHVTQNKYNGTFILSPSVFVYVLKNHPQYFTHDKLCGYDYIVDGRVQINYGCFVDMTKIAVADWTINSTTIDDKTKVKDGIVTYITETYTDFGMVNDDAISVIKIDESNI